MSKKKKNVRGEMQSLCRLQAARYCAADLSSAGGKGH
jgi:hypothetical protein